MYSRLTTEGRNIAWGVGKVIAWGGAIIVGTAMVVVTGKTVSAWWDRNAVFIPSPSAAAAPVYYTQRSTQDSAVTPAPNMFASAPVQQPPPARAFACIGPGYVSQAAVSTPPPVYIPPPVYQRRYFVYPTNFKYPTNFQSGYHPYSPPAATHHK